MAEIQKAPRWLWTILVSIVTLLVIGGIISLIISLVPKSEKTAKSSSPQKEIQTKAPVPQDAEMACVTVVVPAGQVINTYFLHRPRERIHFRRVAGGSSDPNVPPYYIHGDNDFNLPVYKVEFSCQYPVTDTVRLKGGSVTTMVTLSK